MANDDPIYSDVARDTSLLVSPNELHMHHEEH